MAAAAVLQYIMRSEFLKIVSYDAVFSPSQLRPSAILPVPRYCVRYYNHRVSPQSPFQIIYLILLYRIPTIDIIIN